MNRDGLIYTVIVTFIVSFVFVGVLAFANELTKEKTDMNALLFERRAVLNAMGIPTESDAEVFARYEEQVTQRERGGLETLEATVNGQPVTAVKFTGSGLWGQITGVLAVRPDLSRIVGIDIIDHNETPGLGGRIAEGWFKDQFRGERIVDGRLIVAPGSGGADKDTENGVIDGVTGASRTSDSMAIMLNRALSQLQEALR